MRPTEHRGGGSALERLQKSRIALSAALAGPSPAATDTGNGTNNKSSHSTGREATHTRHQPGHQPRHTAPKGVSAIAWPLLSWTAQRWWRRHPASAVVEAATPLLAHCARQRPFQLLGWSAVAGAVLVLTRPWRRVSATTWLGAAIGPASRAGIRW